MDRQLYIGPAHLGDLREVNLVTTDPFTESYARKLTGRQKVQTYRVPSSVLKRRISLFRVLLYSEMDI
jgi:hypothetical protein